MSINLEKLRQILAARQAMQPMDDPQMLSARSQVNQQFPMVPQQAALNNSGAPVAAPQMAMPPAQDPMQQRVAQLQQMLQQDQQQRSSPFGNIAKALMSSAGSTNPVQAGQLAQQGFDRDAAMKQQQTQNTVAQLKMIQDQRQQDALMQRQAGQDQLNQKKYDLDVTNSQSERDYRQQQIEEQKRRAGAPIEVSPAASLYDPATKQGVYTAPPAPRPADTSTTAFEAWQKQNPNAPISEWVKLNDRPQMEPGQYMPLTDTAGRVVGAWNPKSGEFKPTPEGAQGARRSGVSQGVLTSIKDSENNLRKIQDLGALFKPEYVGPVRGRYESVASVIPGLPNSEGYSDFAAANADLKNTVIKLITGAQMGQQEADRILSQIPTENDKPEFWKSKYALTLKNAQFLHDRIKELTGMDGDSTTKPAEAPPGGGTYTDNGKTYNIPADQVQAFLKDHPNAKKP